MACPVCSSNSIKQVQTIPDNEYGLEYKAAYAECGSCGTLYQSPMPDNVQLASFYPPSYHSMHSKSLIARMKNTLRLKKIAAYLNPGDAFFDFGCGNGSFILFASEKFPDRKFTGYEIDGENSVETHHEGRVMIIKGSAEYLKEQLTPCKVISMHHVIEHLPQPVDTINFLAGKLVSGGFISGQTPACDSFERKLFGKKWSGYHAPRHTVIFSRKGLHSIFNNTGFIDVKVKSGFNPAAFAVSLASLFNSNNGGKINRSGMMWLLFILAAAALSPLDRLAGGSIVDFYARKK